jgi:hypothetical protein
VGYSETSKAYRIYVEVSRDVTFHKEVVFRELSCNIKEQEAPTSEHSGSQL